VLDDVVRWFFESSSTQNVVEKKIWIEKVYKVFFVVQVFLFITSLLFKIILQLIMMVDDYKVDLSLSLSWVYVMLGIIEIGWVDKKIEGKEGGDE
jgi:hypothetical protein